MIEFGEGECVNTTVWDPRRPHGEWWVLVQLAYGRTDKVRPALVSYVSPESKNWNYLERYLI